MAESKKNCIEGSFIINEYGVLLSPLKINKLKLTKIKERKQEEKNPTIAEYKIKQVISAIRETKGQQITAKELADKLQITKRSANRILSAMEKLNKVEVVKNKQMGEKGRPSRIYKEV